MIWKCTIPLEPMGKQRPRIAKRGQFARAYTPPKTKQWEKDAATVLRAHWRQLALTGPVRVDLVFYRKRTQEMQRKKNRELTLCTVKPDIDNAAKIALDSLVLAGVLLDDNIVTDLSCAKRWAAMGEPGRVEVTLALGVEIP